MWGCGSVGYLTKNSYSTTPLKLNTKYKEEMNFETLRSEFNYSLKEIMKTCFPLQNGFDNKIQPNLLLCFLNNTCNRNCIHDLLWPKSTAADCLVFIHFNTESPVKKSLLSLELWLKMYWWMDFPPHELEPTFYNQPLSSPVLVNENG